MVESDSIERRAARIKLLLMDCDGVLTDGRIWMLADGEDQKAFNTRDGLGLELFHTAGLRSGIITGRQSSAVERRANNLGISFVRQGCKDKVQAFVETLKDADVDESEVAFVGDDLNDIPLMVSSGLGIAVANAAPETLERADYVTQANGGAGAIREVVELILKAQGRWADVTSKYLT